MKTTFIYALRDPRTDLIRYVGKADDPQKRLSVHLADKHRNHRTNWIKDLMINGLEPVLEIVDEVPFSEWPMWEVAYIENFRDLGYPLVNGTLGGEGSMGVTEETLAKIQESRKHLKRTPESKEKTRKAVKKYWASITPEEKAARLNKTRVAGFGNRVGISPVNKGVPCPEEQRKRISASLKGRPKPIEHLAKLQAGSQRRWEEHNENQNS